MVIQPQVGTEPIEGYRLVERLGSGGFGEVWKAVAPGGLSKAVKFVYGSMDERRAEQELKSLSRIKEVRHPFLLSLERFEVIDGQLIIVTELADYSLKDRFAECRAQGLPGIPRQELLTYIRDAADALDYMSEDFGLQHLDVKPENLLLVGKRVKVADFGLVKDLHGSNASVTGGVTPMYATPEAFDGKVSRQSDQYSLAIVYQEMLTGLRPFPGKTALQLAVQHLKSPPMLDPLCPGDRMVLKRALSKQASDRYPTCAAMVADLLKVETDDIVNVPVPAAETVTPEISLGAATIVKEVDLGIASPHFTHALDLDRPGDGTGGLRPTIFIGIGGIAAQILQRLHDRVVDRLGDSDSVPSIGFLLFDTDRNTLRDVRSSSGSRPLSIEETALLPLRSQEEYRPKTREVLKWLDRRWLYGMPRSLVPEGRRALGRLALVDNIQEAKKRLDVLIDRVTSEVSRATSKKSTGLDVADDPPRVFVVASIAGGTGAGMLVDMGYLVSNALKQAGVSSDSICAILPYASTAKPSERDMARANAYASLIELNHFSNPKNPFPSYQEDGLGPTAPDDVPFGECYVVHFGENIDWEKLVEETDLVAEYLYLNVSPEGSEFFDEYRGNTSLSEIPSDDVKLRSFGLRGFTYPRHHLAEIGAVDLAERIANDWRGSKLKLDEDNLEMELLRLLRTERLEPRVIVEEFERFARELLGASIEDTIQKWIDESPIVAPSRATGDTIDHVNALFQRIELVLERQARGSKESLFPDLANKAYAHATGSIRVMTDWLNSLLEMPKMTIVSAEWATRWLIQYFVSAAEDVQTKVSQIQIDRRELTRDLQEKLQVVGAGRWFGRRRAPLSPENRHELTVICQSRFKEALLQLLAEILRTVYREFSKLTEQFVLIRQRLNEFSNGFDELQKNLVRTKASGLAVLLPRHEESVEEAALAAVTALPAARREAVDRAFREKSLRERGGILAMQTMSSTELAAMRDELVAECHRALLKLMQSESAADLFFTNFDVATQPQKLLEQLRATVPRLNPVGSWQHLVVAMPEGEDKKKLFAMVKRATPNVATTAIQSEGDLVFCFEAANLSLRQVADSLIDHNTDYAEVARQLVTRTDVRFDHWTVQTAQ